MSSSSLFASLGAALHTLSSPFSFRSSSPSAHLDPGLTAFELDLAARLEDLRPSDDGSCLSSAWLCQALRTVLDTHASVEAFVPDLQKALRNGDTKWLDEYLDDSVKLLDICNALREAMVDMNNYHVCINLALLSLKRGHFGEAQLRRALNALSKCTRALKRRDGEAGNSGHHRSKLESCSSMLRRMGEKLNMENASKGNFFMASYAAQVTTIFICGVLTSALSFKSRRPLSSVSAAGQFAWSSSLSSLQHRVKEQVDKRRVKGSIALLKELDRTDIAACALRDCIEKLLKDKAFPLASHQIDDIKRLVGSLQACADELKQGLGPLEHHVDEAFKVLVTGRVALLEIYSQSRSQLQSSVQQMTSLGSQILQDMLWKLSTQKSLEGNMKEWRSQILLKAAQKEVKHI